jgi:hypothetical protein
MFVVVMTELCDREEPYFRPRFLGDKFPTFDYLLELVDHPGYYFFVQVKTTTRGFTQQQRRLRVQVSQTDVDRMVAWPAPTYVVGIDEPNRDAYLLSVNEARQHIASLMTNFRINCGVLGELADEIRKYWCNRDMLLVGSRFNE